jgi:hypothetical protein
LYLALNGLLKLACYECRMSFSLRLGKASLDRRHGAAPADEAAPGSSNLLPFARGLLIGFGGAFFVFDWALMGGATTRSYIYALQHLLMGG